MNKKLEWIPPKYLEDSSCPGTLDKMEYVTENYFEIGENVRKHAWIYLPYGYEYGSDYPYAYFMHGAATDFDSWIKPAGIPFLFKNVLDNMIEHGDIPKVIMVFSTYYQGKYNRENCKKETDIALAQRYPSELRYSLVPAVERNYIEGDAKNFKSNRKKRMFAGFSMGSVITWNVFCECMDLFEFYGPLSGDCWKEEWMGGSRSSKKTARYLETAVKKSGYGQEDFHIFAYTGSRDVAFRAMSEQIKEMKCGNFFNGDNLDYTVMEGGMHNYDYGFLYLYYCLKTWNTFLYNKNIS